MDADSAGRLFGFSGRDYFAMQGGGAFANLQFYAVELFAGFHSDPARPALGRLFRSCRSPLRGSGNWSRNTNGANIPVIVGQIGCEEMSARAETTQSEFSFGIRQAAIARFARPEILVRRAWLHLCVQGSQGDLFDKGFSRFRRRGRDGIRDLTFLRRGFDYDVSGERGKIREFQFDA